MARKRKPIPTEPITATILRLSHDGRGIAEINGKTTFVFGALPGETVSFLYTRLHTKYDEGRVVDVITPSADRAAPICAHFGVCGGCALQHMSPALQISRKLDAVKDLFSQNNVAPTHWMEPITGPSQHYRRKARLSVKHVHKKEKVLVGFRERQGRYVADCSLCPILPPVIGEHLNDFSALIETLEAKETIPQIEISIVDDVNAIIIRHLKPLCDSDTNAFIDFCKTNNLVLYFQPKGPATVHRVHPDNTLNMQYHLSNHDLTLDFHPTGFIQVNEDINNKMITLALKYLALTKEDTVFDAFCGIGNFSLPIAQLANKVIGVEGDETAVTLASNNANKNGLHNCEFSVGNLFEPDNAAPYAQPFDKVLLDPPRSGAKELLAAMLPVWQAKRIVYIACDPSTLARDAAIITAAGYTCETVGILDMFPHTHHVESMAVFNIAKSP